MSRHILASVNIEVGVHRTVTLFGFALNIDTIWTTAIAGVIVIKALAQPLKASTAGLDVRTTVAQTLMRTLADREALARVVLDFADAIRHA